MGTSRVNKVRLRDVLNEVKAALWNRDGIACTTRNVLQKASLVQVLFSTPMNKELLYVTLDCDNLTKRHLEIQDDLYRAVLFLETNWLSLSYDEIAFMKELHEAPGQHKRFYGDISNLAYALNEIGVVNITNVENGWIAELSRKGRYALEELLTIQLSP